MDEHTHPQHLGADCPEGEVLRYSQTDHHGYYSCVPDTLPESCEVGQKWTAKGQQYACVPVVEGTKTADWIPVPQQQSLAPGFLFLLMLAVIVYRYATQSPSRV